MVTLRGIGRKIISAIVTSVIVSIILLIFTYDSPDFSTFLLILMYTLVYSLIIGVLCSIITDLLIYKMRGKTSSHVMGFILHMLFAAVVVYLLTHTDETLKEGFFTYTVFLTAAGLWLIDTLLVKINFTKSKNR